MDFDEIADALVQIQRDRRRGAKSVHQPAALIWTAQRAVRGDDRVAPWHDARGKLLEIVAAVGDNADGVTLENRVAELSDSPIVDFRFSAPALSADEPRTGRWLDERNPLVGLAEGAYRTLADQESFERFAKIAVKRLPKQQGSLVLAYFGVFVGFGEVPGVPVGTTFKNRADLVDRRVHRNGQAGIVGGGGRGAESVVVSGGYEDDEDYGDFIVYTGHGGRDDRTRKQVADQNFQASGNAALVTSHVNGVPVRVIRKVASGFRYDGLFYVEKYWLERGRSGFQVCRFRLVKVVDGVELAPASASASVLPSGNASPSRKTVTVDRLSRLRALSQAVKAMHDYRCQVCDLRLTIAGRGYAQGAHIRPVGRPHDGTDTADNLLCLCPNCHVLFDSGEIVVRDDFTIVTNYPHRGVLRTVPGHEIDIANVTYHRDLFPGDPSSAQGRTAATLTVGVPSPSGTR